MKMDNSKKDSLGCLNN